MGTWKCFSMLPQKWEKSSAAQATNFQHYRCSCHPGTAIGSFSNPPTTMKSSLASLHHLYTLYVVISLSDKLLSMSSKIYAMQLNDMSPQITYHRSSHIFQKVNNFAWLFGGVKGWRDQWSNHVCNYHLAFAQRLAWDRVSWGGLGSCWWGDRWTGLTFPPPSSPSRGQPPPSTPPSTGWSPTWFPPSETPSTPSPASSYSPALPLLAPDTFVLLVVPETKGRLKKS